MSLEQTAAILELQQQISTRLAELGYADNGSAERLGRHLAEIAVLGRAFANSTLPLFLTLNRDNARSLGQVASSIKCDLEEITDALVDVQTDLAEMVSYLLGAPESTSR